MAGIIFFAWRVLFPSVPKQVIGGLDGGFRAEVIGSASELLTTDLAFQGYGRRLSPLHGIRMPQTEDRNLSRRDSKSKQMSKNPHATALGRKGGRARMANLRPKSGENSVGRPEKPQCELEKL